MKSNLKLREKIGQMVMTGYDGTRLVPSIETILTKSKIGNMILFSRNIKSARQTRYLCTEIQHFMMENNGIPAFIAIDQEGGMVSRVPIDATNLPGNMAVSATGDPRNAQIAGEITASELHAMGINIDFAPVLDINTNRDNPVIGVRSYGDRKETVSEYGVAMINGLKSNGVMSVAKHFPGHGDTSVDSHFGLPQVDKTFREISQNELVPFQSAISAGIEGIMTAHILFPKIDKEKLPCTMSRTILTGILRERMKFRGIIFTDCLEMNAIQKHYGIAEAAVAAVKAGADMILVSHTASAAAEAVDRIEAAVHSGEISERSIDKSVQRILFYKEKYAQYDITSTDFSVIGCTAHRKKAQAISRASITAVRYPAGYIKEWNRTLFIGCHADIITPVSDKIADHFNFADYMAAETGAQGLVIPINPNEKEISEILEKAKCFNQIIIGTYNGCRNKGQIDLVNRFCKTGKDILVIALRNPYDLSLIDKRAEAMAAYEYTPLSFRSILDVLAGGMVPLGRLSVNI